MAAPSRLRGAVWRRAAPRRRATRAAGGASLFIYHTSCDPLWMRSALQRAPQESPRQPSWVFLSH